MPTIRGTQYNYNNTLRAQLPFRVGMMVSDRA
jgi:hypothetical protein